MRSLVLGFVLLVATASQAYEFASDKQQTRLLELYTSEGCSSCPPADQWLSGWLDHPGLWQSIIPLAFHVDYWDYIGWSDRFAAATHSARQRQYRRSGAVRSVYTPGFVLNGQEWRGWYKGQDAIATNRATPGQLTIAIEEPRFRAVFTPTGAKAASASEPLQLHIALLGFGLSSEVQTGENRGRRLQHDFVVLSWQQYGETDNTSVNGHRTIRWQGKLPTPGAISDQAGKLAWVAWISGDNQAPIQATGGWRRTTGTLSRIE